MTTEIKQTKILIKYEFVYFHHMLPMSALDLLPQKYPFQMVGTLLDANEEKTETSFTIRQENVMVHGNCFSEGGMIENMAQSAAAGSGYYFASQGKKVPVGYIGAIKKISILKLPSVGDTIHTELKTLHTVGNASIVEGKIYLQKEIIASCELTIFVSE